MEPQAQAYAAVLDKGGIAVDGIEAAACVQPQPLSGQDRCWARMDVPGQPMVVSLVLLLDRPLALEQVRALLQARLLPLARFRQRVREVGGRPCWVEDGPLDWTAHLQALRLPEPADTRALQVLVGRWAGEPLPGDRPLWRCILVDNVGTGSALVFRIHHCIADGVALLRVFLALGDMPPGADPVQWRHEQARLAARTGHAPMPPPGRWGRLRWGLANAGAMLRQLLLGPDARTLLRGRLRGDKRVAWSVPIPLSAINAVRQHSGGRVNDVLLTVVAGALARYLRDRGAMPPPALRLLVPVNLRPYQEEIRVDNEFGAVLLTLPLGMADPLARLAALRVRMERIKGTPEMLANRLLLSVAGWLPAAVERLLLRGFGLKATAVLTNVPGPDQPLILAGVRVERVLAWVPQIAGIGIGISLFSYTGAITVGVTSDSGVLADPQLLVAAIEAEWAALRAQLPAGSMSQAAANP